MTMLQKTTREMTMMQKTTCRRFAFGMESVCPVLYLVTAWKGLILSVSAQISLFILDTVKLLLYHHRTRPRAGPIITGPAFPWCLILLNKLGFASLFDITFIENLGKEGPSSSLAAFPFFFLLLVVRDATHGNG